MGFKLKRPLLRKIAKLCDVAVEFNSPSFHTNNDGFIAGVDEIFISPCDNREIETAIFFHEMGHRIADLKFTRYATELEAWKMGFKLAKSFNIIFSPEIMKFANEKADTYKNYEFREYHLPFYKKMWYPIYNLFVRRLS